MLDAQRRTIRLIGLIGLIVGAQAVRAAPPSEPERERMLEQLAAGDWILQAEAMARLGDWQTEAAVAPLQWLFEDTGQDPWLRGRALLALTAIRGAEAQSDALLALKHAAAPLRAAAVDALDQIDGEVADQALERCLDDKNPAARYRAVAAYARRNGASAWKRISAAFEAPDPAVLPLVARALGRIHTETARDRLHALLNAGDEDVRRALLQGVTAESDPEIIPGLIDQLAALPEGSALVGPYRAALERFTADQLAAPLAELFASQRSDAFDVGLRLLYSRPSVEGGDTLAGRLQKDATLPELLLLEALDVLARGDLDPARHAELFSSLLVHPAKAVRVKAIRNLALCPDTPLYAAMAPALGDSDPGVVRAALVTLNAVPEDLVPDDGIVHYLAKPLASTNAETLKLALDQVRQRSLPEEFDALLAMLHPQFDMLGDETRRLVLEALGDIAERRLAHRVAMLQGYVARWNLIGTFMNEMNTGYDTVFPPEREFDSEAVYEVDFKTARGETVRKRQAWWFKWDVDRIDGRVMMHELMPSPAANVLGYAVADVYCEAPCDVRARIVGNDMVKLWVNGALLVRTDPERKGNGGEVVSSLRDVRLKEGFNRFLVKTGNLRGDWWFSVLLTTPDGSRFEVLHEEPEEDAGEP